MQNDTSAIAELADAGWVCLKVTIEAAVNRHCSRFVTSTWSFAAFSCLFAFPSNILTVRFGFAVSRRRRLGLGLFRSHNLQGSAHPETPNPSFSTFLVPWSLLFVHRAIVFLSVVAYGVTGCGASMNNRHCLIVQEQRLEDLIGWLSTALSIAVDARSYRSFSWRPVVHQNRYTMVSIESSL